MSDNNVDIVYDAIVIGLGGVGSFALRSLSKGKIGSRTNIEAGSGSESGSKSGSGSGSGSIGRFLGIERYTIVLHVHFPLSKAMQ